MPQGACLREHASGFAPLFRKRSSRPSRCAAPHRTTQGWCDWPDQVACEATSPVEPVDVKSPPPPSPVPSPSPSPPPPKLSPPPPSPKLSPPPPLPSPPPPRPPTSAKASRRAAMQPCRCGLHAIWRARAGGPLMACPPASPPPPLPCSPVAWAGSTRGSALTTPSAVLRRATAAGVRPRCSAAAGPPPALIEGHTKHTTALALPLRSPLPAVASFCKATYCDQTNPLNPCWKAPPPPARRPPPPLMRRVDALGIDMAAVLCGGGSVGNGVCADDSQCCSLWGHCGTGYDFCRWAWVGGGAWQVAARLPGTPHVLCPLPCSALQHRQGLLHGRPLQGLLAASCGRGERGAPLAPLGSRGGAPLSTARQHSSAGCLIVPAGRPREQRHCHV